MLTLKPGVRSRPSVQVIAIHTDEHRRLHYMRVDTHTVRKAPMLLTASLGLLIVLTPAAAEAQTCSSVCNQVRRACNHAAKGMSKAARITCTENVGTCRDDCETNASTCPGDCDAASATCAAACATAPDATACEADCAAALAQCVDDCTNCDANCLTTGVTCKNEAKAARDAMREVCSGARDICDGSCEEPIDRGCVHDCTTDEHGCRDDAKRTEVGCKKGCAKGSAAKSCIRTCRKDNNLEQQACEDLTVLCYAGCIGVDLTPPPVTTPTTMAP